MPVVRTDSAAVAEFRRAVAYLDEQRPTAGERFALADDATTDTLIRQTLMELDRKEDPSPSKSSKKK